MAGTFHCTLVTPQEKLLDGPVRYASIPAHDGQVGIAPGRAPLLAQLGDGVLRLDFQEGGSRYFFIGGGFAQMKENRLALVADEAVPAEDLVMSRAEQELAEARQIEARGDQAIDEKLRALEKARRKIALHQAVGHRV